MTAGATLLGGPGKFDLRLLHRQQQPAHVPLEQVRRQAGFLGGAFHEAAALAVPAQVHLVKVEAFARPQTQGDFQARRCRWFFPNRPRGIPGLPSRGTRRRRVAARRTELCLTQRREPWLVRFRLFLFSRVLRLKPLTEAAKEREGAGADACASAQGAGTNGAGVQPTPVSSDSLSTMGSGLSVSSSMTIATGGNGGGGAAGAGRAPVPSHCAAFKSRASDLSAGLHFAGVFVGVHAVRELHPETSMPCALNRSASRCAARSPASSAS